MKPTNMLRIWAKKFIDICDQHCDTGPLWYAKGNSRITSAWCPSTASNAIMVRDTVSANSHRGTTRHLFMQRLGRGRGICKCMCVTTPILGMYVHVPMCPSEIVCRRAESATSESEREQTSRKKHSIHVFWSQRHRSKETSKWLEISNSKHDKRIDLQFIPNNSKWVPGVPSYLQMQIGA